MANGRRFRDIEDPKEQKRERLVQRISAHEIEHDQKRDDFIDDDAIVKMGIPYRALILPAVRRMPEESRRRIEEYRKTGGIEVTDASELSAALKAVLLHNRNEEVEHGMMTLEWLRRRDATFDKFLRRYLFQEADIIDIEEAADAAAAAEAPAGEPASAPDASGSLGIRSLRGP